MQIPLRPSNINDACRPCSQTNPHPFAAQGCGYGAGRAKRTKLEWRELCNRRGVLHATRIFDSTPITTNGEEVGFQGLPRVKPELGARAMGKARKRHGSRDQQTMCSDQRGPRPTHCLSQYPMTQSGAHPDHKWLQNKQRPLPYQLCNACDSSTRIVQRAAMFFNCRRRQSPTTPTKQSARNATQEGQ